MELFLLLTFALISITAVAAQDVKVRLGNGLNDREGRVEILYDGTWGTICDDGWDVQDAAVICSMVGFSGLARAFTQASPFGPGSGPIHLSQVECDGNEQSISFCSHAGWDNNRCTHAEDAGVSCLGVRVSTTTTSTTTLSTTTPPPRICNNPSTDIRLVDGPNDAAGRVQVRDKNRWYAVCDDFWDLNDAAVVCRMLCYNPINARAHIGGAYGNTTEEFLLDDVMCSGDETDLMDCPNAGLSNSDCDYAEGAGVSCLQDTPTPPPLPQPSIECTQERITASFPKSYEPLLQEEYLNVTENNFNADCDFSTAMDASSVSIAIPFTVCGTIREINATHVWYSNVVRYYVPPLDPTITRTEVYYIPVTCVIPKETDPSNEIAPQGRTAPPQIGEGQFSSLLFLYDNNRFDNPVQSFPVEVTLGDWVYAGVSLSSIDPNLKVIVPRCWTTPEADKTSMPQYDLINDGCTVEPSVTLYPINQTMFAFRFQSFRFQGNYPSLFVHCEAIVCASNEKSADCDQSCVTKRRRKRDARELFYMEEGPIMLVERVDVQPDTSDDLTEHEQPAKDPRENDVSTGSSLSSTIQLVMSAAAGLILIL